MTTDHFRAIYEATWRQPQEQCDTRTVSGSERCPNVAGYAVTLGEKVAMCCDDCLPLTVRSGTRFGPVKVERVRSTLKGIRR